VKLYEDSSRECTIILCYVGRKFDPAFFIPFCDCQQGPLLSGHRKRGVVPKGPRSQHTFVADMKQHNFKRQKGFRKRNDRSRSCCC
jgi:hypothetical protein